MSGMAEEERMDPLQACFLNYAITLEEADRRKLRGIQ